MRYNVKGERDRYYVDDTSSHSKLIGYRDEYSSGDLTETEAHIIAFALNAVAEGGTLETVIPTCRKYTGPIDGVAP